MAPTYMEYHVSFFVNSVPHLRRIVLSCCRGFVRIFVEFCRPCRIFVKYVKSSSMCCRIFAGYVENEGYLLQIHHKQKTTGHFSFSFKTCAGDFVFLTKSCSSLRITPTTATKTKTNTNNVHKHRASIAIDSSKSGYMVSSTRASCNGDCALPSMPLRRGKAGTLETRRGAQGITPDTD